MKLVLINSMNQGERFDINYNNIELLFAQIITKMCQKLTPSSNPSPALITQFMSFKLVLLQLGTRILSVLCVVVELFYW